ncbi:MAG: hypothetical protein ACRDP6_42165 [Actinoallomurus sp.]
MAMEGLGRLFNVAPSVGGASAANGKALSLKDAAGVTFILNGADTYTLTVASTYAGSYATPGNIIVQKYTNTAADGTAAWVKASQSASNAVVVASGVAVIYVAANSLPDTKVYVKCTVTGTTGLVTAITHDLMVQRTPANLAILGA